MTLHRGRRIATATLFGVIIFVSKIVLPTPIDKMVVVVQALLLALGFLLLGRLGATFVAVVGGLLSVLLRISFAHFTIFFALLYGLMVDVSSYFFRVKSPDGGVRKSRMMASITLSTAFVGLSSYYVTVYILNLLPRNPILEISILAAGIINGLVGGYLATLMWKKYPSLFLREDLQNENASNS